MFIVTQQQGIKRNFLHFYVSHTERYFLYLENFMSVQERKIFVCKSEPKTEICTSVNFAVIYIYLESQSKNSCTVIIKSLQPWESVLETWSSCSVNPVNRFYLQPLPTCKICGLCPSRSYACIPSLKWWFCALSWRLWACVPLCVSQALVGEKACYQSVSSYAGQIVYLGTKVLACIMNIFFSPYRIVQLLTVTDHASDILIFLSYCSPLTSWLSGPGERYVWWYVRWLCPVWIHPLCGLDLCCFSNDSLSRELTVWWNWSIFLRLFVWPGHSTREQLKLCLVSVTHVPVTSSTQLESADESNCACKGLCQCMLFA